MYRQETFGNEAQKPPFWGGTLPAAWDVYSGGLLGNGAIQSAIRSLHVHTFSRPTYSVPIHISRRFSVQQPTSKLEALKRERFTAEGRAERVARSLAALAESDRVIIRLTPEDWKLIAEDPDLEDDF